jgi:hypothetical protein
MRGQGNFENIDELFALGYSAVRWAIGAGAAAAEQLRNAMSQVGDTDAKEIAGISSIALQGVLRMATNDRTGGLKALAAAAASKPGAQADRAAVSDQTGGRAVRRGAAPVRRCGGAVAQFKASLARTPRRAASLLGLARAAAKAGMKAESVKAAKDFLAAWHLAERAGQSSPKRDDSRSRSGSHENTKQK